MKTAEFVLAIGLLISSSVSAQTKSDQKPDSIKIGYQLSQHALDDTLKLVNPFNEKNIHSPSFRYEFPKKDQNLAQNYRFGKAYTPTSYKMPIVKPNFNSNMPVAKPDSSVHYFIQIIKIGK
jgi:hypothetical protein